MSVIGTLAAFVAGANASDLPGKQRERLRLHVADTAIASLAGASIPEGKSLRVLTDSHALPARIARLAAATRLTEITLKLTAFRVK